MNRKIIIKKVLDKQLNLCYNNQAVSETGSKKFLRSEQRANLENDTEETRTDRGVAKMARVPERGSETEEQSEFYE